jgi:ABC-type dipeptide/oligopeptide/nickel transport system permease component
MFALPGDPAAVVAGGSRVEPAVLAQIRTEWGLDETPARQYARFLHRLVRGDLGVSYRQGRAVSGILGEALLPTVVLAAAAMFLAAGAGLSLGILAAAQARRWLDDLITFLSLVLVSLPVFWAGLMLILLFASRLGWLPVLGYGMDGWRLPGSATRLPELRHLVLPAVTLSLIPLGTIIRITRAGLLEVLGRTYIRSAAARGVPPLRLVARLALRNALIPVLTVIGIDLAALLGGAVATEFVFAWPGLGKVIVHGIADRDLPVVEGGILLLCAVFALVSLLVDLGYAWADPRIRLSRR